MRDCAEYESLKKGLGSGWNTWNTYSVLSHVLLPEGLSINLGIKEYKNGFYLRDALIGRTGEGDADIHPGLRSYDGRYTELTLRWRGMEIAVQSATDGEDVVLLVTPLKRQLLAATLTVDAGYMWNRPGTVRRDAGVLWARRGRMEIPIRASGELVEEMNVRAGGAYLAVKLDGPVVVASGKLPTIKAAQELMKSRRAEVVGAHARFGELAEAHAAMQTGMAWDTIYDPANDRVISPVSRIWNVSNGGWVLFCWDTYFAAYIASVDNRDLAYANAIEITRHMTDRGFVPNTTNGHGFVTRDRSQPPVGSTVVRELYRKFGDRWLVEMLFDDLLKWNRWWAGNRMVGDLLAWGSNPYEPVTNNIWEQTSQGVGGRFGGALESGLDNSPMYDDIPFDEDRGMLALADAGLSGLYIADCEALADLAGVLGREAEATELSERGARVSAAMESLWDDSIGMYCNRRTDDQSFSHRLSPTLFYSLFSRACPKERVERVIKKHFYNPHEFWGDFVLPSIARNDPAYPEQSYWRGRIWAPLNFLTYLALRRQNQTQARADLAERSLKLLLQEWREHGHVCEHYDSETGWGATAKGAAGADRFYHWGGLLGLIALIEAGHMGAPEEAL